MTTSIRVGGCAVVSGALAFFWEISCRPENTRRPHDGGYCDHHLAVTN
ncbi:MAG TPA: hypothetical protein VN693_00315 [Rhodanobacteraceae bacterium]|nr:hypothetical protein [Rhodanobacteraceae bacterium]